MANQKELRSSAPRKGTVDRLEDLLTQLTTVHIAIVGLSALLVAAVLSAPHPKGQRALAQLEGLVRLRERLTAASTGTADTRIWLDSYLASLATADMPKVPQAGSWTWKCDARLDSNGPTITLDLSAPMYTFVGAPSDPTLYPLPPIFTLEQFRLHWNALNDASEAYLYAGRYRDIVVNTGQPSQRWVLCPDSSPDSSSDTTLVNPSFGIHVLRARFEPYRLELFGGSDLDGKPPFHIGELQPSHKLVGKLHVDLLEVNEFHTPVHLADELDAFLPLFYKARPVELQRALADIAQSTWGSGSFEKAFADLEGIARELAALTPNIAREKLLEHESQSSRFKFGPIAFSYTLLGRVGLGILLGLQLYFLVNLTELNRRLRVNHPGELYAAWMLLYPGMFPRTLSLISVLALPMAGCVLTVMAAARWGHYVPEFILLVIECVILLSIAIAVACLWRTRQTTGDSTVDEGRESVPH